MREARLYHTGGRRTKEIRESGGDFPREEFLDAQAAWIILEITGVAESADATDLKSVGMIP